MAKLSLTDISAGYLNITTFNANNTLIEAALENTLSRNGITPNAMEAQLDMNSYRLVNLPNAVSNQEPITLGQAASLVSTPAALTQDNVGAVLYPETADETTAAVTVVNYHYPPGNVLRYGSNGTPGTTDMSTAIQAACDVMDTAGGGLVLVPSGTYRVDTALTVYGGTILRGEGRGQRFSTFDSETGTIIIAGAAMTTMVTTATNAAGAGGAVIEDILIDGQNNATNVVSMEGIRDVLRNATVTRGTAYGVINNVAGVAEQLMDNVIITMDSQGTAGWYIQNGSDSNYINVVVHGCATGILVEAGGHQFSHIHPYPSPIDPTACDWLLDIHATSDNFFVNCHFDQVHKADRAQVRIRTGAGASESCLDNEFIACSFDNPSLTAVDVVGVYMDASPGSSSRNVTACFTNCTMSGNGTNKFTYAFEKEATRQGSITYSVIGGIYNNVTTLWSHAPDTTFGVQHMSGGITEVGTGGVISRGQWAMNSGGEVTIASGAITVTDSHHRVDTEADAPSDDLDTINGGVDGEILVLQTQSNSRDVTVKDGTGNLAINDDFTLRTDQATIVLQYHKAGAEWVELARTPGAPNVAYTPTNVVTDRDFNANAAVLGTGIDVAAAGPADVALLSDHDALVAVVRELADVVGTLIADLQTRDIIG